MIPKKKFCMISLNYWGLKKSLLKSHLQGMSGLSVPAILERKEGMKTLQLEAKDSKLSRIIESMKSQKPHKSSKTVLISARPSPRPILRRKNRFLPRPSQQKCYKGHLLPRSKHPNRRENLKCSSNHKKSRNLFLSCQMWSKKLLRKNPRKMKRQRRMMKLNNQWRYISQRLPSPKLCQYKNAEKYALKSKSFLI